MKLRIGNEKDKEYILRIRPHAEPLLERSSYFLVAEEDDMLAFAVVMRRNVEAPVSAMEAFVNVIEVFDECNYCKGIASCLVQKIVEIEKESNTYQIRAYCDINNVASHRLWQKNGFGISPVKESNGQIPGSFVTFVCK